MAVRKLKDNVYSVGAIDWDRRLFDELIPLPDGTSYNSYIIFGKEKTALIDTVDPSKTDELINNLKTLKVKKIDYVIANHAEQDHSGSIPKILELFPEAKVVTNSKCISFLKDLLHIPDDKFIEIKEGDKLDLGGKTLEFIFTPWVHWPETMSTYLIEDKIIFTCDFFGSHKATSHLFACNVPKVIEDAKRYYAEIMMPFRFQIRKNMEKILKKEIDMIAPSHGPVYNDPKIILDAYKDWISDEVKNKVLIPFVSMHDSTKLMVERLVDKLIEKGIEVVPMNLVKTDMGMLAMELVDSATLVIATPYVLAGVHPLAVYAAYLINALRPKLKYISVVSSYGWGGMGIDQLKKILSNIKAEWIDPVLIKGLPRTYEDIDNLAEKIYEKHKELGVLNPYCP